MTISQIDSLPQFAKDVHERFLTKIEAAKRRLEAAAGRANDAVSELNSLADSYDKMATETDSFLRTLSNSPAETKGISDEPQKPSPPFIPKAVS